ncbi:MAG: hypothetical protein J0H49_09390 [Acidobacteria bacterium]|nr:hypothetical protein [Acidobacteriota bacterium]
MSDSLLAPDSIAETILEATLEGLGGEPLEGSGFEEESAVDLDVEAPEVDES